MELSDWVNKITFSEILFLPAIFDRNNPKNMFTVAFQLVFLEIIFLLLLTIKSDNVNPSPKYIHKMI